MNSNQAVNFFVSLLRAGASFLIFSYFIESNRVSKILNTKHPILSEQRGKIYVHETTEGSHMGQSGVEAPPPTCPSHQHHARSVEKGLALHQDSQLQPPPRIRRLSSGYGPKTITVTDNSFLRDAPCRQSPVERSKIKRYRGFGILLVGTRSSGPYNILLYSEVKNYSPGYVHGAGANQGP